jgi:lysophospholipase L1-like esterase
VKRRSLLLAGLLAAFSGCAAADRPAPVVGSSGAGSVAGPPGSGGTWVTAPSATGAPTRTDPDSRRLVVVVIGASTASGKNLAAMGAAETDSWVHRYAAYLAEAHPGARVVNLAVAGHGTFEGLPSGSKNTVGGPPPDDAHNVTAALRERPSALIVNYPSGDIADGFTVEHVMQNLEVIAQAAGSAGVPLWVATPQPSSKATAAQRTALLVQRDRTLSRFGDHALDFFTPLATPDGAPKPELLNGYDHVHPNPEGHRLLFEVVKAARIVERLAQPPARDTSAPGAAE